ncbi:GNAT family N-acetyltransferase [Paenibacillus sp. N1-5-1-14]|uniref:GNAT family N-acetyltransferase n=1 Tax=Paenibacillus radicibacter TaxID=2972488 RepID=UPI0021593AAE|nr:GNAT family N-acetyltransferase [Paenibacillus radicibacter]MCR8642396.1 GNAT family N-acetyltransferase [Paenibacillus radicibacter]
MSVAVIETERLILRSYTTQDAEMAYTFLSDPITMSFWSNPLNREQALNWVNRSMEQEREYGYGRWLVLLKETGTVIGDCGLLRSEINGQLENDLGYILHHSYWKQGYAVEAAQACLNYGLSPLKLDSICTNMPFDHTASRRVSEKIGMEFELAFINKKNRDIRTLLYRKINQA